MTQAGRASTGDSVVVIGIGNPFRGDDGAGIEVARRLRALMPPGVEVLEQDGESTALIDAWQDGRVAYVIDAVRADGPAGEIHRIDLHRDGDGDDDGGGIPSTPSRDSSHALGLGDAVELARVLDRLPSRLVLIGIAGTRFDAGDTITEPVLAAIDVVVEQLAEEVRATCA